ncbi:MAG: hypothetical protein L0Z46_04755 [Nitrospiraceae bacterium]|nr:hypothetical protein [Nitrospiraceae bacterium]
MLDQVKESQNDMTSGEVLSGGPGIVVLSPSLQILHMNRQAIKLASLLGSAEPKDQQPYDPTGVLSPPLTDLAGEILRVLRSRHEMSEKGQFEIRHAANGSGKQVSIRGVGVPNGQGVEHARIVLVLTEKSANLSEHHQNHGSVL